MSLPWRTRFRSGAETTFYGYSSFVTESNEGGTQPTASDYAGTNTTGRTRLLCRHFNDCRSVGVSTNQTLKEGFLRGSASRRCYNRNSTLDTSRG